MKIIIAFLLFFFSISSYSQVTLVKELNAGITSPSSTHSDPAMKTKFLNEVYFMANNESGSYIFKTDGNVTTPLLDLKYEDVYSMIELNAEFYVFTDKSLFKLNATQTNFDFIKDLNISSNELAFSIYTNHIFFSNNGRLWKTDGTSTGTIEVNDIAIQPKSFAIVNGLLLFSASSSTTGRELWKTDGTYLGTNIVTDINPGSSNAFPTISEIVTLNNFVVFSVNDGVNGQELWKSDGTSAGTSLIKDIYLGSSSSYVKNLVLYNSEVYFSAQNSFSNTELWKTDGTTLGTVLVKDINTTNSSNPEFFIPYNGELFFTAFSSTNGNELWKTNGTTVGTVLVKDIISGANDSNPINFCISNNKLFFGAKSPGNLGIELWKTDGTTAGTVLVKDIFTGMLSSTPEYLVDLNGTLIFTARSLNFGDELWKSDGTNTGTILLKDIKAGYNFGNEYDIYTSNHEDNSINFNGQLFFAGNSSSTGQELWKSDGTTAGTNLFMNINPLNLGLEYSSNPDHFTRIGNKFLFTATTETYGKELWISDGTVSGTQMLKDLYPGVVGSNPSNFYTAGNKVYFWADGSSQDVLWVTDGTVAGTKVILSNILSGTSFYFKSDTLYFTATYASNDYYDRIYYTLGTSTTTYSIWNYATNASFPKIGNFVELNNSLYFLSGSDALPRLSKITGTTIQHILTGTTDAPYSLELAKVNNTLIFPFYTSSEGFELWSSDGSSVGTTLFYDISNGASSSSPSKFNTIENQLYFACDDGSHGIELWKSDGTLTNTLLVKDINPGRNHAGLKDFRILDGNLYFSAMTNSNGFELYKTNGSDCNTMNIAEIGDGVLSSNPILLQSINNDILFYATDELIGRELYKVKDESIIKDTACYTYTWNSNNQTYTESGIYYDTLISSQGCDSIITLNLYIYELFDTVSVTKCGSYLWDKSNLTYTSSGLYSYSGTNDYGCLVNYTLDLTILSQFRDTINQYACTSFYWNLTNQTYTTSGFRTKSYVNSNGCDSTFVLNLIVFGTAPTIQNVSSCSAYTWPLNNVTYNYSTVVSETISNSYGCDSIVELHFTYNPIIGTDAYIQSCTPYTWPINGVTYTSFEYVEATLQSSSGCDSIVSLLFDYTAGVTFDSDLNTCSAYIHNNDTMYYGNIITTYTAVNGCDSLVVQTINYQPIENDLGIIISCNAYTNGTDTIYYSINVHDTLTSVSGCDSIVQFYYDYFPEYEDYFDLIDCGAVTVNGTTYTQTGLYVQAFQSISGCDSLIYYDIYITPEEGDTVIVQTCNDYTWPISGQTYTSTGIYHHTVSFPGSCDSVFYLQYIKLPGSTQTTTNINACGPYTWSSNGITYNFSGVYYDSLISSTGCDSIQILNLQVNPIVNGIQSISTCIPYTWSINNVTYSVSGNYADTIINSSGCFEIFQLNLVIDNTINSVVSISTCDSYIWNQTGLSYTNSGQYYDTIFNPTGCDSIITLMLTIYTSTYSSQSITACDSYTWPQTGQTYTISGNYNDTIPNVTGCDSIITLILTIDQTPNISATASTNNVLTATGGTTFQWINCTTNQPINGASSATFTPTVNGTYAAIVGNGNACDDTTNCITISTIGLSEISNISIELHPNPTNDLVRITFDSNEAQVFIYDTKGKLIQTKTIHSGEHVSLKEVETGVYFFEVVTEKGSAVKRVVKD